MSDGLAFGTNDSPLAGTEGKDHKLTARMIKDRLDRELKMCIRDSP